MSEAKAVFHKGGFRRWEQHRVCEQRTTQDRTGSSVFGALTFVGVLLIDGMVEVADCAVDPDYWNLIDDDPDDGSTIASRRMAGTWSKGSDSKSRNAMSAAASGPSQKSHSDGAPCSDLLGP